MGRGGADSNGDRGYWATPLIDPERQGELKEEMDNMTGTSSNTWGPPEGWQSGDGAWKYSKMGDGKNVGFTYKYMYPGDGRRIVRYGRENAETPFADAGFGPGGTRIKDKRPPEYRIGLNKMKDKNRRCTKGMGCNNSGGPDEGGWDAGFGADGTQLGHQYTMVDTPTSLNDPARLANKVPGTGRSLSEHWGSWLDEHGYLTHATSCKKHEDETDATDAHFDRQLPDPDFETHRGQGRILSETNISGRTRKHGDQGGWH